MHDKEMHRVLTGVARPVGFRNGRMHLVQPGPLSGPIGIVRELPLDFWHPSMAGASKEELVGDMSESEEIRSDEVKEDKPLTWGQRLFVWWAVVMIMATMTLAFFWFAAKVIENL